MKTLAHLAAAATLAAAAGLGVTAVRSAVAASAAAGAAGAPPSRPATAPRAAAPQPPETFSEKVLVREIEVVVELPESLRESRRKALGPQDFLVTEDGRLRQVVKASPVAAGESAPWQVVIYVDRVLADPETVFFTANALAKRAAELTALGTVALVVADPAPRLLFAETREPRMLEQALTDIAAQAERQRDAASSAPGREQAKGQSQEPEAGRAPASASAPGRQESRPPAGPPSQTAVRRQEDQLVSLLAGRAGGGPRALVLVADGFDTSHSGGGADSATQAVAEEPARTLAAYGWITLAAPMRRQDLGDPHRETTDLERIRQSTAGPKAPEGHVPPEILPQAAPRSRLQYDGVLNLFVQPASESLNAMASATGGTVIGYPGQLASALTGLAKRWHIFYLAPDPEDGRPRPVEVHLSPEGTLLRAPVWRRSSTPDEVAAARLREVLAGGAEHGTLPVTATATLPAPAAGGGESRGSLRLTVGAFAAADSLPAGPFRVSLAFAGTPEAAKPPTVQHRLLTRADLTAKGWTETLTLDVPSGARTLGVAVEDLTHQVWGATAIDLGPAPAAR
jgi:hypothetical protein